MKDEDIPNILYHYASVQKAFSILTNRNIRLSDVTKSNDINEMSIFFPDLFDEILNLYDDLGGFDNGFVYKTKHDRLALQLIINELKEQIEQEFKKGCIATFVLCLSEKGDLLSQWRGYADDGKGLSLGLNIQELVTFIKSSSKSFYELVKVKYLSDDELKDWIKATAKELLWLIDTIMGATKNGDVMFKTASEFDKNIYETLYYNILGYIEESIRFKSDGFAEEAEWRFYIKNALNKEKLNTKIGSSNGVLYEEKRSEMNRFVFQNVKFNATENDIIPFISLGFDEFNNNLICDVKCGPNNKIRKKDLELLLRKHGYETSKCSKSRITYISR